jgi:acetyltransferase-like isoleucine patch superfamily enzyme
MLEEFMKGARIFKSIRFAIYYFLCLVFYRDNVWLRKWNPLSIRGIWFYQKILNMNRARSINWPVHFSSKVSGNIVVGEMCSPGYAPGCYIAGKNGIIFGSNVFIGPGVKIISANHSLHDLNHHLKAEPIRIGSNVWIGANAVILPGVKIGDGAVIGAGAIVTKDVEEQHTVVGNPARVIRRTSGSNAQSLDSSALSIDT